jgi:hypothetical protein
MKTYDITTYSNWKDLANELTAELNELINLPLEVEHIKYGDGVINSLNVSVSDNTVNILSPIDFNGKIQPLALNIVLARNLIEIPEPAKSILIDFSADCAKLQANITALSRERMNAKIEADKQAQELAKQEAKLKARMDKGIQDFETLKRQNRNLISSGEFIYAIGWLANNCNALTASMPDYILPYFEKQFDTSNYKPSVVDSKKLTSTGNAMKYTLSMQLGIAKKSRDSIPAVLLDYINDTKTAITDTSFIWDLIETYGFQLGSVQDVDKIRTKIPNSLLDAFEKGYTGYTGEEGYAE